jgi:hypothetical protein
MLLDPILATLENDLRASFNTSLAVLLDAARTQLEGALAELVKDRAKGLA